MTGNIWCLLGLLLLCTLQVCNAVDSDCQFRQELEPGKKYYISNPNYPYSYAPGKSCIWHAVSTSRVRLTCDEFLLPSSPSCSADSFNVYVDSQSGPKRYCGDGKFTKESNGNEMVITLETGPFSPGGKFRCLLETVEDEGCRCGWKKPTKIVGGTETGINEYPMMAAIINFAIRHIYCGATIISPKYVLTAAHCIFDIKKEDIGVLVGEHDLTTGDDTNATELYPVANYVTHPAYVKSKKDYDIAAVLIAGTIRFSNEVGPACLPFQHSYDSFGGSFVEVLGWGSKEYGGPPSDTLQKVKLSVTNFRSCKEDFRPTLEYRQMCTYGYEKDACQFDSGGPVLWQNPTTRRLVLVGIISYGSVCASDEPAVNTRVGAFIDWIVQVTPGANYCRGE